MQARRPTLSPAVEAHVHTLYTEPRARDPGTILLLEAGTAFQSARHPAQRAQW